MTNRTIERLGRNGCGWAELAQLKAWAISATPEQLNKAREVAQRGYNRWTIDKYAIRGKICPLNETILTR